MFVILKRNQVRNIHNQFKTRNIRLRLENLLNTSFSVDILSKLLPVLLVYDLKCTRLNDIHRKYVKKKNTEEKL